MKRVSWRAIVTLIIALPILMWFFHEIWFQIWLRLDERRVDFAAYETEEEIRAVMLSRLSLGSPREDVVEFVKINSLNRFGYLVHNEETYILAEFPRTPRHLFWLEWVVHKFCIVDLA